MTTLAEHAAFLLLDKCAEASAAALKLEIGEPETQILSRALLVVSIARAKFKDTDVALAPARSVEIASNAITTMRDHLVAFLSQMNVALLSPVDQASNDILTNISTFHDSASPEELRSLSPAMTTFRSTFESSVASVRARAKQVEKEMATISEGLTSVSTQITEERQRLSSTISEFQAQFSTAQEGRLSVFSTSMDQQVEKFRALQDEYGKKLLDHEGELSESAKKLAEDATERMNASIKARSDEADQLLEKINKSKRDVEALVGVIGNLGVTSGYVTVANSARNSKRLWQITAVLSLIALIGFELWTFVVTVPAVDGFTIAYVASRVAIGLSVGLLAAYAATMAERSASAERKNRRLELELQAIDPFLERLPADKRDEFKLKIGERCFGQTEADGVSGSKISATMFG